MQMVMKITSNLTRNRQKIQKALNNKEIVFRKNRLKTQTGINLYYTKKGHTRIVCEIQFRRSFNFLSTSSEVLS